MPHPLRKECGRYVLVTHYLRLLGPIRDCAIRRWAPQVQGPYALHSTPTTGRQRLLHRRIAFWLVCLTRGAARLPPVLH